MPRPGIPLTDPSKAWLLAQFDRELNVGVDPATTAAGTRKKLWWRCPEGPDHVWPATGNARDSGKRGCRACAGYQVSVTNSLAQPQYAHIAAQLDPDLNDGLTPDQVVATTHKRLWWRCPKGPDHTWRIAGEVRVRQGTGCPACAGRQVSVTNSLAQPQYAHVAAQLDPDLNAGLTPDQVIAGSNTRRWWRCPVAEDHVWRTTPNHRTSAGQGCRSCAGLQASVTNSLAQPRFADIAAELDPDLNSGLTPDQVVAGSDRKLAWRCRYNPEHTWKAVVASRTRRGNGCERCYNQRSLPELQVAADLQVFFPDLDPFDDWVAVPRVPGIRGTRVRGDIVLRKQRVVIEYDGCYWHGSTKAVERDARKTARLMGEGWRVIRVRERPLPSHVCPGHDSVPISPGDAKVAVTGVLALLEDAGDVPSGTTARYAGDPGLLRPDVAAAWWRPPAPALTAGTSGIAAA